MYLVRTELMIRAGQSAAFEARQKKLAEAAKGMPGYQGVTLLHSYSHPAKYTVTLRFDNVEAAWDYGKSDVFASYISSQSPGSVTVTQQEGYESVLEVNADPIPGEMGCEVLVDWTLKNPGVAREFESSRRELFELRKQHTKGFVSNRLRQSGGKQNRYLVIAIYTDRETARGANAGPEIQAFQQAHSSSRYSDEPIQPEAHAVLYRM